MQSSTPTFQELLLSTGWTLLSGIVEDAPSIETSMPLLTLDLQNNPQQFSAIYSEYYDCILNYLYRRTMNLDTAQDLTSETFTNALNYLKNRRVEIRVKPWLYRIATNVHCSHYRRDRRWSEKIPALGWIFQSRSPAWPDERISQVSDAELVREALLSLPEKHRTPLMLRFYDGLGMAEIAEVLGIARGSVGSRMARSLHALQKQLSEHETRCARDR